MRLSVPNPFNKQLLAAMLLNAIVALIFWLYIQMFGSLMSRYTAYFFVAPFLLIVLFQWKNPVYKTAAPIFTLIFLENVIISRIPAVAVPYMNDQAVFFRLGVTFIFALTAVCSFMYYKEKFRLPRYMAPMWLLFLGFALASMVIGGSVDFGLLSGNVSDFITYYLEFFLFFYLGYRAFESSGEVKQLLLLFVVFGIITAVAHIFAITTGTNLESLRGQEAVAESRDLSQNNWRYGGFLGNVNTMSAFYVMLIPASLYMLFSEKAMYKKVIAAVAMISMLISMLLGASRGGLLWSALGIIVALFYLRIGWQKIIGGLLFVAAVVFVANSLLNQFFMEYLQRAFDEISRKGTDSPREMIWYYTMFIIRDNPFGIGLSTHNYAMKLRYYANMEWSNPHNMYLEMITQTGFAGLVVFISIVGRVIASNIKAYIKTKETESREALVFLLLFMAGFMLMGFTEPIFRNQYKLNHLFGLLIGISMSLSGRILTGQMKNNNDNTTQENAE